MLKTVGESIFIIPVLRTASSENHKLKSVILKIKNIAIGTRIIVSKTTRRLSINPFISFTIFFAYFLTKITDCNN